MTHTDRTGVGLGKGASSAIVEQDEEYNDVITHLFASGQHDLIICSAVDFVIAGLRWMGQNEVTGAITILPVNLGV